MALALVAGLAHARDSDTLPEPEKMAARFKLALKEALLEGLARGPSEAVAACRVDAPEIAKGLSTNGIQVGRTSHRLRNPANAPSEWVKPVLDAYLANASDRAARTIALPNGRSGYVEPLITQPLCLTCHGGALAPEVGAKIEELYPDDEATGFEVGDLRGVLWITYPASK